MRLAVLLLLPPIVLGLTVTSPSPSNTSSAAAPNSTVPLTGDTAPGADGTQPATATPVSVFLRQGGANVTITGTSENGVDSYFGIPFAEPPTGPLRFAHPVPITYNDSLLATTPGPACLQPGEAGAYGMSEDCLSLNVMVPSGPNAGLPVMVWIHGGTFATGTASQYLTPSLVTYGAKTERPFVFVAFNYRLGIFGFLGQEDSSNLGLWDQRLALEWVREHVGAFGGDWRKVTVFGHSAGASSIGLHMLNTTQNLFRAAIMQSGAPGLTPTRPSETSQAAWDELANLTGCNGTAAGESSSNPGNASEPVISALPEAAQGTLVARHSSQTSPNSTLQCLRSIPADTLITSAAHLNTSLLAWGPSVDGKGGLVPQRSYDLLQKKKIARIPFIIGNTRDEGTYFAALLLNNSTVSGANATLRPSSNSSGMTAAQYLKAIYPHLTDKLVKKVLKAYPDVPAFGAPFNTGNETFGLQPAFKQLSAILTDAMFVSRRRALLRTAGEAGWFKTWSYEFDAGPRASEAHPAYLGYSHTEDLAYIFHGVSTMTHTLGDLSVSESMLNYWLNFAYYLDPNGQVASASSANAAVSTYWRQHMPSEQNTLRMSANGTSMVMDDAREKAMSVWSKKDVARAMGW